LEDGKISIISPFYPVNNQTYNIGDRVCPGQHLGTASVWLSIATMLATLKISKAMDDQGNEIALIPEMTTGLERYVLLGFGVDL
jgi:hypothetical protein